MEAASPRVKERIRELLDRSKPLLPRDLFTPVRATLAQIIPHFISPVGVICTNQPEFELRQQTEYSPLQRWTFYNHSKIKAPLVVDGSNDALHRFRGQVGRLRELAKTAAVPASALGLFMR
jgi:hypothetical protein